MSLFKITGLILILAVCTALGFLKALSLKARVDSLCEVKQALLMLKEKIRLRIGDKARLINECFNINPESTLSDKNGDLKLWREFYNGFGLSDTENEYKRCTAYISLFDNKINDAQSELLKQQKLYKSLGFLSGLFICIFFI